MTTLNEANIKDAIATIKNLLDDETMELFEVTFDRGYMEKPHSIFDERQWKREYIASQVLNVHFSVRPKPPKEKPFNVVIEWHDKDHHVLCTSRRACLDRGDSFNFSPPTPDFNMAFDNSFGTVILTEFAKQYHKDSLAKLKDSITSVTVRIE